MRRVSSVSLFLFTASALSSPAFAVDTEDQVFVVGEYLFSDQVNALKAPTPIIDVPQSLSIITADEIAKRGFTSIGQVIDYTPGVNTSLGEGHRDAVVFRGVRSTADFFIDGSRDDVQYYRPLYNLEQLEILRGPNALLFGRGGTGGILNRVTKKGVLGETFVGYQTSVDTFGEHGGQIDINFSNSESVAFRLNAMYEGLNNHRDLFDGDRFGINPTVKFKPGQNTVIDLSYEYVDHERFVDRGIPTGLDGRPVEDLKNVVFADPELNYTTLEAHLLRGSIQHTFNEALKGNLSVFYGDYDKVYSNLYASGYDQVATPDLVTLDGYIDTTQRENLVLSGNLVSEIDTGSIGHTFIAGGEYINTSSDQNRFNTFWDTTSDDNEIFLITRPLDLINGIGTGFATNPAGVTATNDFTADLNDDTRVDIDVFSFYLQDQIELATWLDVVVGLRYDSFDIGVNNLGDPANPEFRERKDEEISPRFGIILKPRENISIYGSYSESFLPRSGEQFANINSSKNALDPDTFENIEVGVKWDFVDGLSLTAAIFEIEQSSPQVADSDPDTLDIIDSQIRGFEAQLQGYITERWFVSAGYSYLDGERVTRSGPTGLRPRELPENMFSVWNNYQVNPKFTLGVGLTYQDETFITNGPNSNGVRPTLPSYLRIDAAASYYISDKVTVQVNIENLTDTVYFPNAHSTHQAGVGAPINARFALSGRF